MTISDAFSQDCTGLVFEPPCPDTYVANNVIVGNLIVQADSTFGGGGLNVTGSATAVDGSTSSWAMNLDSNNFSVASAGDVTLTSADKDVFNGVGGNVSISAGSGVSVQGGSGGSLELTAGSGYGEEQYGGGIGVGGDVTVTAGGAIEGDGGDVTVAGGSTLTGTGGKIELVSGSSQSNDSGDFKVATAESSVGASGSISVVSGSGASSSGTINIQSGTSTVSAGGIYIAAGTSMSSTGGAVSSWLESPPRVSAVSSPCYQAAVRLGMLPAQSL